MTQLVNVLEAPSERPNVNVMHVAMKLLGRDELKVACLLVLKCCFILVHIAFFCSKRRNLVFDTGKHR